MAISENIIYKYVCVDWNETGVVEFSFVISLSKSVVEKDWLVWMKYSVLFHQVIRLMSSPINFFVLTLVLLRAEDIKLVKNQ